MPRHRIPPLISSAEVAEILDVERSTVTRLVAAGRLEVAQRAPGIRGALLFDPAAVARYAEARAC